MDNLLVCMYLMRCLNGSNHTQEKESCASMHMQAQPCSSMPNLGGASMNDKERMQIQRLARRAREQRNATKDNESYDYWQGVMENLLNQLKTGENK